ncbi:uncharacterized protein E0L32_000490 [Thyridium curvatum]|uniref:Uncharacterized protein n=1 Tax=Thyridium curvatum TaxID=1093900 RepID=A0A507B4T3_9PEZI|nr:uncharacterized protein E0L32_000490 [Thyridium curvatum]TPX14096.1 hypothetical protein E0L32_000490 [Thyridium curvatum]
MRRVRLYGWNLNILGPSLLDLPSATVRNQMLNPDGPGYKLLAFEGDAFTSNRQAVANLATARKIREFATAGLPILVVGNWSSVSAYGRGEAAHSAEITSLFADILGRPNVANVAARDDIGAGGAQQQQQQLVSHHRADGDLDHFLLVAAHPATYAVSAKARVHAVEADVVLPRRSRRGVPLLTDLWTGQMTPLGQYTEAAVITVAPLAEVPVHAVASDAQLVRRRDGGGGCGLYMRANATGTYTAELSDGRTVIETIRHVPRGFEIKGWTLAVQSWEPTEDMSSHEPGFVAHELGPLDALRPWTSYPEPGDVSGVGTYNASFTLGGEEGGGGWAWSAQAGATHLHGLVPRGGQRSAAAGCGPAGHRVRHRRVRAQGPQHDQHRGRDAAAQPDAGGGPGRQRGGQDAGLRAGVTRRSTFRRGGLPLENILYDSAFDDRAKYNYEVRDLFGQYETGAFRRRETLQERQGKPSKTVCEQCQGSVNSRTKADYTVDGVRDGVHQLV